MPIYEFQCGDCGAQFEDLVPAGTEAVLCPECGSTETKRRFSAFSPAFKLAKSPGNARKQEAQNAKLHAATKRKFKETRRKRRDAAKRKGKPGG
jgi:putative FmdB family regulatory protein